MIAAKAGPRVGYIGIIEFKQVLDDDTKLKITVTGFEKK